ncbi:MAG: hypothetical protein AAF250_04985 [Pseudomonadota bacterium]
MLTLGWGISDGDDETADIVTFEARDIGDEPETEEEEPAPEQPSPTPQEPQPVTKPTPALPEPQPLPPSPLNLPTPNATPTPPPPAPAPSPAPTEAPPAQPASPPRVYGPPDTGGSQSRGSDSRRVGNAPNGEPLYAARWYREPTDGELSGYLSTANGPGSALIACKTVPDFYVEDCQLLGESPAGSQIGRAVLAAAWQFRVRPARIGGRSQVGSWVRIRIDYTQAPPRR